jgi:hypothetical protein
VLGSWKWYGSRFVESRTFPAAAAFRSAHRRQSRTDFVPPVQCHVLYFTDKVIYSCRMYEGSNQADIPDGVARSGSHEQIKRTRHQRGTLCRKGPIASGGMVSFGTQHREHHHRVSAFKDTQDYASTKPSNR